MDHRDSQALKKIAGVRAIPRVWLDDAKADIKARYWIKGLVEERSFVVVFGPSGDGKTFFTLDAVCHIAAGLSWRDRRVKAGLVVYVAAEAGATILRRFTTWRDSKLSETREGRIPLSIVTKAVNLLDEVESAELIGALQLISEEAGQPLAVVVFDTLARSMAGGDENGAGDMGRVIAAADRIRDELGAATLVIHHSGKDPQKGARGSSALYAAADTVISVVEKVATVEKARDGKTGEAFPFTLRVVDLGIDDDGDQVTTCLVEPSDQPRAAIAVRLNDSEKVALQVLKDVLRTAWEALPGTSAIPAGARGVNVEAWRSAFFRVYAEDRSDDATKKAFNRAKAKLIAEKVVGGAMPWVWLW